MQPSAFIRARPRPVFGSAWQQNWPAVVAGLAALALYARTLAPGLTWAHHGADGGDLLAAALTGGVPHPTGYPTYQLLLRTALAVFPGEPARAGNWLSALAAAGAVALLADLARRILAAGWPERPPWHVLCVLAAALSWAASPLLWSQAVITEVYTLHALAVVLVLWLLWRWREARQAGRPAARWLVAAGLAWGVGLGNHLSLALLLPAVAVWIWSAGAHKLRRTETEQAGVEALAGFSHSTPDRLKPRIQGRGAFDRPRPHPSTPQSERMRCSAQDASVFSEQMTMPHAAPRGMKKPNQANQGDLRPPFSEQQLPSPRAWLPLIAGLALGLSIYVYLPLAAGGSGPVNWGDARTPAGFWWLVSGRPYAELFGGLAPRDLLARLAAWGQMARAQLGGGPWGLALALAGLWWTDRRQHAWWWTTGLVALAYTAYSLAYRTADSYVYLIPVWAVAALWLAAGLGWIGMLVQQRRLAWLIAVAALILLPTGAALRSWPANDLSHDHEARDFVAAALSAAEPDAIILTAGDRATFALWYAIYGLGQRPDVIPLNVNLYAFEWYRTGLHLNHPDLLQAAEVCSTSTPLELLVEQAVKVRPLYRAEPLDLTLPWHETPAGVLVRLSAFE